MVTGASPTGQRAAVASSYFTTAYVALSIPVIGVGVGAQAFGWARAATVFCALVALLPLVVMLALLRPERSRPVRELTAGTPPARALPQVAALSPTRAPAQTTVVHRPRAVPLPAAANRVGNGSPLTALRFRALPAPVVPGPGGPVTPAPPAVRPAVLRALPERPTPAELSAPAHLPALANLPALAGPPSPDEPPEPADLPALPESLPPRVRPLPTRRATAPQPPLPPPWHAPPSAPHEAPPPRMPHPWRRPPHRATDATAEAG
jgi:hypothetical protein